MWVSTDSHSFPVFAKHVKTMHVENFSQWNDANTAKSVSRISPPALSSPRNLRQKAAKKDPRGRKLSAQSYFRISSCEVFRPSMKLYSGTTGMGFG